MTFFIIFGVAFCATFLSSMSGGGASIITVPSWLLLGMSFPAAVTVEKISATFWVIPAAYNYLKQRKIDWVFLLLFAAIGLGGAYLAVQVVVETDETILRRLIGIFILLILVYVVKKKNFGLEKHEVISKWYKRATYIFALPMGFYEALFGSGNGALFSAITIKLRGLDFIEALGYYFAIAFFWVAFAALLFIEKGFFNLSIQIPAVIGSSLGSYLGSRFGKQRGNQFLKWMFVSIGGILGIKMILGI